MSDPWGPPWSAHPNAPRIPSWEYLAEKEKFAGFLLGIISYGIVVALFFQCTGALLNPANPIRRDIKWALVVHTVALFLFLTIPCCLELYFYLTTYIDTREFPGNDEFFPGPLGYGLVINSKAFITTFDVMFPLNQWLADGLLLHRCYVIYSMNHRVMALPYLMYLASIATGIVNIYYDTGTRFNTATGGRINASYYSICLSLNILLTLMIVVRLIMHIRNLRRATGEGSNGLHTAATTVVTMLIESYALYAVALLLFIVPSSIGSWTFTLFNEVIGTAQVIAPYLIILRVAKRRAITSESISGAAESIRFRSQRSTDDDGSIPDSGTTNAMEANGETTGERVAGDENAIEEVPL